MAEHAEAPAERIIIGLEDLEDVSSSYGSDSDSEYDDAQEQWEESLEQLKGLVTLILVPLAGKFLGRRFAYFVWGKYVEYESRR
ncbi:mitochondrial import protein 2 [Trichomonascus vanleenenianus]|uniref:Mim2p n=1 Tax=Trichomonascus vanleenenianus TaxID=2268995 RepID=UPI003ECB24FE